MKFERSYAPKSPRRCSKLIYIITEGSRREPEYFKHFSKDVSRFKIEVIERNSQENNSPVGLLQKAEKFRSRLRKDQDVQISKNDEFWIVVDVDTWPNLQAFVQSAQSKKWKVAVSNPCFEVWLYYHLHPELPQMNISEMVADDWKQLVDVCVPGGFNSAKHYSNYQTAVENARAKYSEQNGIPIRGTTSVFRIFEELI